MTHKATLSRIDVVSGNGAVQVCILANIDLSSTKPGQSSMVWRHVDVQVEA